MLFTCVVLLVAQTPELPEQPEEQDASEAQSDAPDEADQASADDESRRWYEEHRPAPVVRNPPPQLRRAVDIGAGYGIAYATDAPGSAGGFTAEAAYVWFVASWFAPRVYAGTVITGQGSCGDRLPCDVTTQVFYVGGQTHFVAPIPYFGPFVDAGIGVSFGTVNAISGNVDEHQSGVMPHLKLGAGVALGERNQYEIGLRIIDHFTAHSIAGGIMLGLRIPL